MTVGMHPAVSRGAAVAILLLLLGVGFVAVVEPVRAVYDGYERSIADLQHQRVQYSRIAATRPMLQAEIDTLEERRMLDGALLQGGSQAIAAAALQEQAKDIITKSGGQWLSAQTLDPEDAGVMRRIAVKVEMAGTMNALQAALYQLESGTPTIIVDEMMVRPAKSRKAGSRLGEFVPVDLSVSLSLSGFWREEGS